LNAADQAALLVLKVDFLHGIFATACHKG